MIVRFNGCDLADESKYLLSAITGWDDMPELSDGTAARPRRHGSWLGGLLAPKRVVTVDLKIVGKSSGEPNLEALRELKRAASVMEEEVTLVVDLNDGSAVEQIKARVTSLNLPIRAGFQQVRDCVIEFTATDPRRYSVNQYSASTTPRTIGPGRPYPMSGAFAYATTAGTRGAFDAVNGGNTDTLPSFTIRGPLANPSISIGDKKGRRRTTFGISLSKGESLVVDPSSGAVAVNGADRFGIARGALIEDLYMRPGLSTVTLGGTGTGRLTMNWRDATL